MKRILILLALTSSLLLAADVGSAPEISFYAIGGSGGPSGNTSGYLLMSIVGQPVTGFGYRSEPGSCSGYLCSDRWTDRRVYLPVVQK